MPSQKAKTGTLEIKTDNRSLADKVSLRRLVIAESGLERLRVLDLYAGEGHVWTELRRQPRVVDENHPPALNVEKYTPVDAVAKQPGQIRFKVAPRLIEALADADGGLSRYNVIDIDTYGEPWALWQAVLFRIKTPTCVFATRGRVAYGAGRIQMSRVSKQVMGMPADWDVPCKEELIEYSDRCQLLQECPTARLSFAYRVRPRRSVDYYGLFVIPSA